MKKVITIFLTLGILLGITSCTSLPDPYEAGTITGVAYAMTKEELHENDRKNFEIAYGLLHKIASEESIVRPVLDLLVEHWEDLDLNDEQLNAVTAILQLYWNKLVDKFDIENQGLDRQLFLVKEYLPKPTVLK